MASWYALTDQVPTDGDIVWCRVLTFYSAPVLMRWSASSQTFTTNDTGLTLPWYFVVRWKPQ